ncbi:methyltransferase domain-containing protein [Singulisphaera sp. Ch08]|uniref:Methyltransferase domain-containing protein n=1 Tax=Singulisphaera sp. Ch08 TaxID=3120278 RepID=A0AAU7CPJ6_9BACT
MKKFECVYLLVEPFTLPLHKVVRRRLRALVGALDRPAEILDVGGRKSHYTIGIPGSITITDLPRETEVQRKLHLGINGEIVEKTYARRSNVKAILYDDMTESMLLDGSFDCVVAVEVLEHVEQDAEFVRQVHRVLRPGGVFLMTTPNGDYLDNHNPDHKRHYTREQLQALLVARFGAAEVDYAVRGGTFRTLGLRPWSVRRPLQTAVGMASNIINTVQSSPASLRQQARGTHHLVAEARRSD